jgi:hypothetical protein
MSLSPPLPKKGKYVEKPGNPNLLVLEEEEKEVIPLSKQIERDPLVIAFENVLSPLLTQALVPLYTFIGYLEAESGKRIFYRYDPALSMEQKMNPLVKGAVTVEEFKTLNWHLGPSIVNLVHVRPIKPEPIGINIDQFRSLYRRLINPNASEVHIQMFPVQLWDILPTSTFQFIIEKSTFGAMDMAAKELDKDLKLLIISDCVNYKFAQFVAKKFISPKQNAFASGMQGGQMQYRIASGFNTSVASNTKMLLGTRHWFKDVVLVDNPALKEVEPMITQRSNQLQELYRQIGRLDGFPQYFADMTSEQFEEFDQELILRQLSAVRNEFTKLKYEYESLKLSRYPKVYWR